jgi:hypothetical protein
MAETKKTTPRKSGDNKGSVNAVVFVPSGRPMPRDTIFKTAITAVRDQIPVVYVLTPEIADVSDVKTVDGVKGREYTVAVNYETDLDDAEPVNVDAEIEKLTVPALPDYQAAVAPGPADDPR